MISVAYNLMSIPEKEFKKNQMQLGKNKHTSTYMLHILINDQGRSHSLSKTLSFSHKLS